MMSDVSATDSRADAALIAARARRDGDQQLAHHLVRFTSLTSSGVKRMEHCVIGGYQYEATPRSFARLASFWSKVAMASYRLAVARAAIASQTSFGTVVCRLLVIVRACHR